MQKFEITREIGIDAGHRVTYHGSKCRNLHGHRYTVEACLVGNLFEEGEQQGMVLDFGFLKQLMMDNIDYPCDHGMILWINDPYASTFYDNLTYAQAMIDKQGFFEVTGNMGKLYLVPFVPTAENLAKHWFERLLAPVESRCYGQATLKHVKVWETPNAFAIYPSAQQ